MSHKKYPLLLKASALGPGTPICPVLDAADASRHDG